MNKKLLVLHIAALWIFVILLASLVSTNGLVIDRVILIDAEIDTTTEIDTSPHIVTVVYSLTVPDMSSRPYWFSISLPVKLSVDSDSIANLRTSLTTWGIDLATFKNRLGIADSQWDSQTSKTLFSATIFTCDVDQNSHQSSDGINSIACAYLGTSFAALCYVTYDANSNSATYRKIFDVDIRLNTYDGYIWSTNIVSCPISCIDLQAILTHELGHGVGCPDLTDSSYSYQTMYYLYFGMRQRTIEAVDIAMLQALYGA